MSEHAPARHLRPRSRIEVVARRKCTPSTKPSTDVTVTPSHRVTAASSPDPITTRPPRSAKRARIASINPNSDERNSFTYQEGPKAEVGYPRRAKGRSWLSKEGQRQKLVIQGALVS